VFDEMYENENLTNYLSTNGWNVLGLIVKFLE
jgi:hypothetical protein